MEQFIALIVAFFTSLTMTVTQMLPGPKMAEVAPALSNTTQISQASSPTPAATPTPSPTPKLVNQNGWVRIYVQSEEHLPYPASVQGECDYNNTARKVPPCRGGLPGYVVTIYESATGKVILSPPTDNAGWVTVYLSPGNYHLFRYIRGGQPYLPADHRNNITIVAGKGVAGENMIIVEP